MPPPPMTPGAASGGAEHHVWFVTSFNELVDFSIAELPRHPRQKRADGIAMPAIWWNNMGAPLTVFRYLPDAIVSTIQFSDQADMDDLAAFVPLHLPQFTSPAALTCPLAQPFHIGSIDQIITPKIERAIRQRGKGLMAEPEISRKMTRVGVSILPD